MNIKLESQVAESLAEHRSGAILRSIWGLSAIALTLALGAILLQSKPVINSDVADTFWLNNTLYQTSSGALMENRHTGMFRNFATYVRMIDFLMALAGALGVCVIRFSVTDSAHPKVKAADFLIVALAPAAVNLILMASAQPLGTGTIVAKAGSMYVNGAEATPTLNAGLENQDRSVNDFRTWCGHMPSINNALSVDMSHMYLQHAAYTGFVDYPSVGGLLGWGSLDDKTSFANAPTDGEKLKFLLRAQRRIAEFNTSSANCGTGYCHSSTAPQDFYENAEGEVAGYSSDGNGFLLMALQIIDKSNLRGPHTAPTNQVHVAFFKGWKVEVVHAGVMSSNSIRTLLQESYPVQSGSWDNAPTRWKALIALSDQDQHTLNSFVGYYVNECVCIDVRRIGEDSGIMLLKYDAAPTITGMVIVFLYGICNAISGLVIRLKDGSNQEGKKPARHAVESGGDHTAEAVRQIAESQTQVAEVPNLVVHNSQTKMSRVRLFAQGLKCEVVEKLLEYKNGAAIRITCGLLAISMTLALGIILFQSKKVMDVAQTSNYWLNNIPNSGTLMESTVTTNIGLFRNFATYTRVVDFLMSLAGALSVGIIRFSFTDSSHPRRAADLLVVAVGPAAVNLILMATAQPVGTGTIVAQVGSLHTNDATSLAINQLKTTTTNSKGTFCGYMHSETDELSVDMSALYEKHAMGKFGSSHSISLKRGEHQLGGDLAQMASFATADTGNGLLAITPHVQDFIDQLRISDGCASGNYCLVIVSPDYLMMGDKFAIASVISRADGIGLPSKP